VRIPRLPLILVTVLAVLLGVGWLGDSIAASRVERNISAQVEDVARLEVSPSVYVGGVPYLLALFTGEIPSVEVTALDVDVAGLGMVNATTRVKQVTVTPEQVRSGDIEGAPAELMSRTIGLDGVSFGHLLDMTDLDIANPYDISPAGGSVTEAQLTGTPPGFEDPVSVVVSLRLVGEMFHMEPVTLVDAPTGREDDVRAAFTYSLDTRRLPLAGRASSVVLGGGSIYFEAQRHNVRVRVVDLSPVEVTRP